MGGVGGAVCRVAMFRRVAAGDVADIDYRRAILALSADRWQAASAPVTFSRSHSHDGRVRLAPIGHSTTADDRATAAGRACANRLRNFLDLLMAGPASADAHRSLLLRRWSPTFISRSWLGRVVDVEDGLRLRRLSGTDAGIDRGGRVTKREDRSVLGRDGNHHAAYVARVRPPIPTQSAPLPDSGQQSVSRTLPPSM